MAKPRVYSDDDKAIALAFYAVLRDLSAAAKKAKVDETSLAFWVAGGDEQTAIGETTALVKQIGSVIQGIPGSGGTIVPEGDLSRFDYEGDADYYTLADRRDYEQRRVQQIVDGGMPLPPVHLTSPMRTPILIHPDLDLGEWVHKTFIGTEESPEPRYRIEEHAHLLGVPIGFMWMNTEAKKKGNQVIGTAELVGKIGDHWQTAEYHYHLMRHFGDLPTFLIRLDAVWCAEASPIQIARLIDHELCHCGVKMKDGSPATDRYGNFTFITRGHDVEEFVGPVDRWGLKATHDSVKALVAAANRRPVFEEAEFDAVCCGCGASF